MPNRLHVLLLGGPLHGVVHEINPVFGMPDKIGLPDDRNPSILCWYEVRDDGTAEFSHEERKDQCRDISSETT